MWENPTCITGAGRSFYTHLLEVKLLHLHVIAKHRLSAFASVFLLPTHTSPLVSIMVSMSQHLGGCHSQGCHGYALRSAVVHAPPPATQAPSTKLISHLCGYLKTIIIACISLKHPPDD